MGTTDWGLIWKTFEQVVERPPAERADWLDRRGIAGALRHAVDDLLRADGASGAFFDRPLIENRLSAAPPGLAKGDRLGAYRVLRRLGQGGMSVVYLALRDDGAFDRRVVIKLVKPGMECELVTERLRAERRILAALEHPNIARLHDGGSTAEGAPYFVMEYVDGEPIDRWCERHRLSIDERVALVRKVCGAVQAAHQNLVVHRDLKPSNILVDAAGEPKLLDFGIAKLLNPALVGDGHEPTATVHRLLTPSHASPEQIAGRPITTASDVYSLGVLLYELLTGRLPRVLTGRSLGEAARLFEESEPLPPSLAVVEEGDENRVMERAEATVAERCRRRLEGDLDAIVLKALRSSPRRRYGSVEQLAADLERFQDGLPVSARNGTWRYRAGKFLRRHGHAALVALAMVLVLVGFLVASMVQGRRVAFERDQARSERDKKAEVLALVREIFHHASPYKTPGEELTVRQALERSLPAIERGLDTQADVRAELFHTTARILLEIGRPEEAQPRLEEALALYLEHRGPEHPDTIRALGDLSATHRRLGEFEPAETLARRAVAAARRSEERATGGPELVAEALLHLAGIFSVQADYAASEPLAREALDLLDGPEAAEGQKILALEELALAKSWRRQHGEAVRLGREALERRRRRDGPDHPGQIKILYRLGADLYDQGRHAASRQHHDEAFRLLEASFGEDHIDPYLFGSLGNFHAERGNHGAARDLYRQAVETLRRTDPDARMAYYFEQRLAWNGTHTGSPAEAETELRRLLATWRPRLLDHWQIDEGTGLLGEAISIQGRCEEAEPLLVESFEGAMKRQRKCLQRAALRHLEDHFERCGRPEAGEAFALRVDGLEKARGTE